MHEHLRDIAPVWLILGLVEKDLDSAEHPSGCVFGRKYLTLTASHTLGNGVPIGLGFRPRHGKHETHRRAAFDAVDEHFAQTLNLPVPQCVQSPNSNSAAHDCGNFEQTTPDVNEGVAWPLPRRGLAPAIAPTRPHRSHLGAVRPIW